MPSVLRSLDLKLGPVRPFILLSNMALPLHRQIKLSLSLTIGPFTPSGVVCVGSALLLYTTLI